MKNASRIGLYFERGKLALTLALALAMTLAMGGFPGAGQAMKWELGDNGAIDMDVHLQWSGAWRLESQADQNLAKANSDDGNRNFDKGDMVNNLWSATIDIDARYKNFGVFLRPRAYYDFAYDGTNANDSPLTNNNGPAYGGPLTATDEFMQETQDLHKTKSEILDAFAYGSFDVGQQYVNLRVGRQVVNWGQGLFSAVTIGTAMNPLDATKLNTAGVEVRDVLLPTGQGYALMSLPGNFSLSGYYKWEYDKNRLDESGAYFSNDDYLLDAGRRFIVDPAGLAGLVGTAPTVDRRSIEKAKDDGEYGVALTYLAPWLADTEFGFYYVNYHDKMPTLDVNAGVGGTRQVPNWALIAGPAAGAVLNFIDDSSYDVAFKEDIKLYGFSFGTAIGDANVNGEVSYRQDVAVLVESATSPLLIDSYKDADALSALVNAIYLFGPGPGSIWDQCTFVGEVGLNQIYDMGDKSLVNNAFAWGGTAQFKFDWLRPIPSLYMDISLPVTYAFAPEGKSSLLGGYQKRDDRVNVTTEFTFYNNLRVGLGYTAYLHTADSNWKADRDLISTYVKYSF